MQVNRPNWFLLFSTIDSIILICIKQTEKLEMGFNQKRQRVLCESKNRLLTRQPWNGIQFEYNNMKHINIDVNHVESQKLKKKISVM